MKKLFLLLLPCLGITVSKAQNIGIGTTDPRASLHVDSSVLFTGNVSNNNPAELPAVLLTVTND